MTLLLTCIFAVIATLVWYFSENARRCKIGNLCYMLWGAAMMWFVDAIFEYAEQRASYFEPTAKEMLNDTFLGFAVLVFALIIWIVMLLLSDPKGVVKEAISK